jgi:hypothetical protein
MWVVELEGCVAGGREILHQPSQIKASPDFSRLATVQTIIQHLSYRGYIDKGAGWVE